MAEEIVAIKIIGDSFKTSSSSGGGSASSSGAGGMLKGAGDMMSGVLKGIGLGSVIGIVVMIAGNMKSLMNMISSIIKMISYLVKPIADVVMILLMPILMMLKPLVVMVNQVMQPFIKLSMQLMREGMTLMANGEGGAGMMAMGAASGVMMQGLSSVIAALSGSLLNMVIEMSTSMISMFLKSMLGLLYGALGSVLNFFGVDVTDGGLTAAQDSIDGIMTGVAEGAKLSMDGLFGTIMALQAASATAMGETFGINTDEFQSSALKNIEGIFTGNEGLTSTWQKLISGGEGLGQTMSDEFNSMLGAEGEVATQLVKGIGETTSITTMAIKTMVSAWQDAFTKSKGANFGSGSFSGKSGAGGSWGDDFNNEMSIDNSDIFMGGDF